MATLTLGLFLFDEVEVLDFAGPFEVFSTASRVAGRLDAAAAPPFRVVSIGRTLTVRARAGLTVQADHLFDQHAALDVLLIPGGEVSGPLADREVIDWIARTATAAQVTAAVCTGAFLLAEAGLLDGLRATTHWEDIAALRRTYPQVQVESDCRWLDQGRVLTSAGISAGIDMSLHLVERLAGSELAERTARQMDFDWSSARQRSAPMH